MNFKPSQYKLLARYCEKLSLTVLLAAVIGFFIPGVIPNAIPPTLFQLSMGTIIAFVFLWASLLLTAKSAL